jgi:hypothetical protein
MKRCTDVVESKAISPTQGYVGIWWAYNNHVDKYACRLNSGFIEDGYVRFIHSEGSDIPGVETGEVVYDIRSQVYEIICNHTLAVNADIIRQVAEGFNISDLRYDIIPTEKFGACT